MEMYDDDLIKRELLKKSEQHREELKGEVKLITEKTERIITNALIIGGSLALTYYLVNQLSGSKRKGKRHRKVRYIAAAPPSEEVVVQPAQPEEPGVLAQIGTAVASQASLLLLSLAKEKLTEFVQAMGEKNAAEK